jgi:hypothetical protein
MLDHGNGLTQTRLDKPLNQEKESSMNAFKITWDDGNTTTTDMNATLDEAKRYYIGQWFNFGDTDWNVKDDMHTAVEVVQL